MDKVMYCYLTEPWQSPYEICLIILILQKKNSSEDMSTVVWDLTTVKIEIQI